MWSCNVRAEVLAIFAEAQRAMPLHEMLRGQMRTKAERYRPCKFPGCEKQKAVRRGARYCLEHAEMMQRRWKAEDRSRRRADAAYRARENRERRERHVRKRGGSDE